MQQHLKTLLQATITQLVNTPSPRLDAELLLCQVLQTTRSHLYAWPHQIITERQQTDYQSLVQRRLQGEPIAYILGYKEFWSLPLYVTPATLIPRPETELLVELALTHLPKGQPMCIFDLGTGNGALALALAHERPDCSVIALDNTGMALAVAQFNAQHLGIHTVRFLYSDWYTALNGIKANVIVSNPPYVATTDPHLEQGDVRYEPRSALASGKDGLDDLRHLITYAPAYLEANGWLLVEHGYCQAEAVAALFKQQAYVNIMTHCDLAGQPRVTEGQRKYRE